MRGGKKPAKLDLNPAHCHERQSTESKGPAVTEIVRSVSLYPQNRLESQEINIERKLNGIGPEKRELHELPYAEIVKFRT